MVSKSETAKISFFLNLLLAFLLEVIAFSEKKRGEFTIQQRKKKREIFEEQGYRVEVPPDVSEEKKKALEQTGDDATQGRP